MFVTDAQHSKCPQITELHAEAVHRVINTIRKRLDEDISLKDMASLAYMSRFHFIRTFRRITGLPPRRFLSALRVESATRMLLDTDHRVTDICFDVGYNSLGTFIRRFSDALGVSPMKLRLMRRTSCRHLLHAPDTGAQSSEFLENSIKGRIVAPSSFSGLIFIGLFPTPIPEGTPSACTIRHAPGTFSVVPAPQGKHYLFALGLPWPDSISDLFSYETALRGGGNLVYVEKGPVECNEICLRPRMSTDPPILLNLPFLLGKSGVHASRVKALDEDLAPTR